MSVPFPRVLREEPQFRLLFTGQALSVVGDRITTIALPFATLHIGGDASDVGLVAAALTVPFLLFALLGGVWADRLPRHRLMLGSDVVRLVVQLVAAGLLLGGVAEVWHLVVLMAIFGTADAFFQPAMVGLMPSLVRPELLQDANALRSLTMSTGQIAGPAIGGVLVAALGPGGALAVDAATFAVSCTALALLRPRTVARDVEPAAPNALAELRAGFREVWSRGWVRGFLLLMVVYHVVVLPAIFVLGPVLADAEYGGASSWALVSVAFGLGAVVGDLLVLRFRPSRPLLVAGVAFVVASCQAAILGSGLPIEGIAALEAVTGAAVSIGYTLWELSLQEHIPEASLSRVSSYDYLVTVGLMPVGLTVAGPLSDLIGLHELLAIQTVVAIPIALLVLASPAVRGLRRKAPAAGDAAAGAAG
ncbi:MFS transporter [Patulibacter sp. SYSU D01012]|uniref:MFS transporter n=1 Tax=Patulibacter sp. SYSU D01012 TaxID=2817381 RepID=UPI001B316E24|nr:MFS transporter [Patulibacter sp. SYSU D01012]